MDESSLHGQHLLETPYRGDRRYVHGTDIFAGLNSLVNSWELPRRIFISELTLMRVSKNLCFAMLEPRVPSSEMQGVFWLSDESGRRIKGHLCESSRPPEQRLEYNERPLNEHSTIRGMTLYAHRVGGFSVIQTVVGFMKILTATSVGLREGRWMFSRLRLSQPLPLNFQELEMRLVRTLPNQYSRATIEMDGERIGQIQFVAWRDQVGD